MIGEFQQMPTLARTIVPHTDRIHGTPPQGLTRMARPKAFCIKI